VIVQAKTQLHIPCPSCTEGGWRADHLTVGFKTTWHCDKCQSEADIERVSESDFNVTPTGRKATPVVVTLQSVTIPKIVLKLNTWKCSFSQGDSPEDYESHQRYFYDEHICPTNWTREIVEIIFDGDHDPHGVFEFVSVEDGHMVYSPHGGEMILSKDGKEL
jgi:ribosomal protein S27AE